MSTHLPHLYQLVPGRVEVTALCGKPFTDGYDFTISFFIEQNPTFCSACVSRWYMAKKEEKRIFELFTQQEADSHVVEAGQRLDGSFVP